MLSTQEYSSLRAELLKPLSWHWMLNEKHKVSLSGLFQHAHSPQNSESLHVTQLLQEQDSAGKEQIKRLLEDIKKEMERSPASHDVANALHAIRILLAQSAADAAIDGFHVNDLPIEEYTAMSETTLAMPAAVEFALSQGGVLQSARECVTYRMHKGKEDLNYYYTTRTVAIYYIDAESGELLVAFDDNPLNNILLSHSQEGYDIVDSWLVDMDDAKKGLLIRNAIENAKQNHRVINVTVDDAREDAREVSNCIIGDKTDDYNKFLQQNGYKGTRAWTVTANKCSNVSARQVLIRSVGVVRDSLFANDRCDFVRQARGVQTIWRGAPHNVGISQPNVSRGKEGVWVPYVGLYLNKDTRLFSSHQAIIDYFQKYDRALNKKAQNVFYAVLAATKPFIKTLENLDIAVALCAAIAPALIPLEQRQSFFRGIIRQPYYHVWLGHTQATVRFFEYIATSKNRTRQFITMLEHVEKTGTAKSLMPFFVYLLENRPKQLLDILSSHSTLYVFDERFSDEMSLLATFAQPITAQEYDVSRLRTLITPLHDLDERLQTFFLQKMAAFTTYGDPKPALQNKNVNIAAFSFADMSYVQFSFLKNKNVDAALKKLPDIQKKEKKLQTIITSVTTIEQLNTEQQKMLRATTQDIANAFFDIIFEFYTNLKNKKLESILKTKFSCKIIDVDKKVANQSFHNALLLLKNVKGQDVEPLLLNIIQEYLASNIYPFKNPTDAYPWTLPQNKNWLAEHSKAWQEPFEQEYTISEETQEGTNTEERIQHHLDDAKRIITQLNINALLNEQRITLENLSISDVTTIYKELSRNADKYDKALLSDLRTQQNALQSLIGQQKLKGARKIIITAELDPLEILQMGNYVQGSCLSVDGSNKWSAIVNATEANKRVLWAKDERNNIIARVLIAVDDSDRIVRFPSYYATNLQLNIYFNEYIQQLAKRCNLSINGSSKNVENLIAIRWYHDAENNV